VPLYNLACRAPLAAGTRSEVARAITDTHCGLTGAPRHFVNVVFLDNYPLRGRLAIDVIAAVRSGGDRGPAELAQLEKAMQQTIADAADLPLERVGISLTGFPAHWIIEGGQILPDPGAEAD